jgi:ribonuclease VapC
MEALSYVFDAFAVLAYLEEEPGADQVGELLEQAKEGEAEIWMHALQVCEVFYITWQSKGETDAYQVYGLVQQYPIKIEKDVTEPLLLTAGRLKAIYSISYADSFSAALALLKGAHLVTGDPEFKPIEKSEGLSVLWLPK